MGFKALCAAAALAIGVGQAEAATVDRVTMTLRGEYVCALGDCEGYEPAPSVNDFYGLPIDQAVTGFLSISQADDGGMHEISFSYSGGVSSFGWLFGDSGSYYSLDYPMSLAFVIDWNGAFGSLWYEDDDVPHFLVVNGAIELAPVPLPATAALLPLGFGALALMRKRRRSATGGVST